MLLFSHVDSTPRWPSKWFWPARRFIFAPRPRKWVWWWFKYSMFDSCFLCHALLRRITSVPQKSMFFAFWRGEYHISRIWQFRLNRTYHESPFFWSSRYIKVQSVLKLQVQTIHRLPGCWYITSKIFSIISIHLCHVSAKCASKPTSRSALRVLSSQILG